MTKRLLPLAIVTSISAPAFSASSDFYLKIEGISRDASAGPIYLKVSGTGDIDGDGAADQLVIRVACAGEKIAATHYVAVPRDSTSGVARGKRQHGPVTFIKEWGPATPQLGKVRPGYDVKTNKDARMTSSQDGWNPITLTRTDGLCLAAQAALETNPGA